MSILPTDQRDRNGRPLPTIENFVTIMENAKRYEGVRFNELCLRAEVHSVEKGKLNIEPWTDANEAESMHFIEKYFGMYSKEKHAAALKIFFERRKYNPLVDIIDRIEWDGVERCKHLLTTWM